MANWVIQTAETYLKPFSDAFLRELSRPIVEAYYTWLQSIFKPAGKLKKAITYSLNQREYLCAFLDHGEIEISNNQVENAIRPIVVGRKNWLAIPRPGRTPVSSSLRCWKLPRQTD